MDHKVELRSGDTLRITVRPRYDDENFRVQYDVVVPDWGLDDGWEANLVIECQRGLNQKRDNLALMWGDDVAQMDFGEERDNNFYDEHEVVVGKQDVQIVRISPLEL